MNERRTFEGKPYEWHGGDWPCQLAYRGACKGCPKEANCVNADGSWVPLDPRIPALETRVKELEEIIKTMISDIDGLVAESAGVIGFHLNGDIATWNELLPGGYFERFTGLDDARAALEGKEPS